MFQNKLVSIITPMYNSTSSIEKCIISVNSQSYQDYEHIIIDDCSTDDSCNLIKNLMSIYPKIKLLKNEQNVGPSESRNNGIKLAKGRFIAFIDSDDTWKENKLELQIERIRRTKSPLIFSGYNYTNDDGKIIKSVNYNFNKIGFKSLLKSNWIYTSTVLVDRKITGEFFMPNHFYDDYLCWLKLIQKFGPAIYLNRILMDYTVSSNSISRNKIRSLIKTFDIYNNQLKFSLFKSFYLSLSYIYFGFKKRGKLYFK